MLDVTIQNRKKQNYIISTVRTTEFDLESGVSSLIRPLDSVFLLIFMRFEHERWRLLSSVPKEMTLE